MSVTSYPWKELDIPIKLFVKILSIRVADVAVTLVFWSKQSSNKYSRLEKRYS